MNADRAAARIVRAVLAGRPMCILTPMAKVGVRVRGLAPATTARLVDLIPMFCPRPRTPTWERRRSRAAEPKRSSRGGRARVVRALATLGDRAARRNNEAAADA